MRQPKATPKLTQDQIINLLIDGHTLDLLRTYRETLPSSEFVQPKNLATLQKMVKSGILSAVRYSGTSFTFSTESMRNYAPQIRQKAIDVAVKEWNYIYDYAQGNLNNVQAWAHIRFTATDVKRDHDDHQDFSFFKYYGWDVNLLGETYRVYARPALGMTDDTAYQFMRAQLQAEMVCRAEIAKFRPVEIIAY